MCGRFAASASTEYVVEIFQVEEIVDEPAPSWNVAPTDPVVVVEDVGTVAKTMPEFTTLWERMLSERATAER